MTDYVVIVEMPGVYIREMIADMLAMSVYITGSEDMTDWLDENESKIKLHNWSRVKFHYFLEELGYYQENGRWKL